MSSIFFRNESEFTNYINKIVHLKNMKCIREFDFANDYKLSLTEITFKVLYVMKQV